MFVEAFAPSSALRQNAEENNRKAICSQRRRSMLVTPPQLVLLLFESRDTIHMSLMIVKRPPRDL